MILYEYYCLHCDKVYEARTSIKERNDVKCPECGRKLSRHYNQVHLSSKRVTYGY